MSLQKKYVLKNFDRQIKKELKLALKYAIIFHRLDTKGIMQWKQNKKNLRFCISYFMKEIFLESFNFTVTDWRIIRTDEYFIEVQKLSDIEKKVYTLQCILNYKNKYKL